MQPVFEISVSDVLLYFLFFFNSIPLSQYLFFNLRGNKRVSFFENLYSLMMHPWVFLSLFTRSKGLMCLMSSVHIIADYMWLHETHVRAHCDYCDMCGKSAYFSGLYWDGHCGRWLITFIVGELAYVLMPHACKINNMLNEVTHGPSSGFSRNICANYENYKWHIIYEYLCPGLCFKQSHADRAILLEKNYIMKISQKTSLYTCCTRECNGLRGLYNLQD